MKKRIRLTEDKLRKIVRKCVNESAQKADEIAALRSINFLWDQIKKCNIREAADLFEDTWNEYPDVFDERWFGPELRYLYQEADSIATKLEDLNRTLISFSQEYKEGHNL
jgi:hypothetical protein